jgi:hypothetical protein
MLVLIPAGFLIFGAALIVAAARMRRGDRRFAQAAERARGTVVGVRWRGGNHTPSAFPVVRYTLPDGRTVEAQSSYGARRAVPEGTAVDVLYDPANPQRIELAGSGATGTFLAVLLGFMGAGFLGLGAILALIFYALRDAF